MVALADIQRMEVRDSDTYFPGMEADLKYIALALAGEVGEVCNDIKKWDRGDFGNDTLQERLEGELPDVLIYLVMLAGAMDINLEKAWTQKKEYNDSRFTKA